MRKRSVDKPIGVFDSGLGGLTIVREIRKKFPRESVVYFGDMARLPYGIKSKDQILRFSVENTLFLLSKKVKAVVVACNSSSSAAYQFLKGHFNLPVIDVIEPAVTAALNTTKCDRVGVIATQATIESLAYTKLIQKRNPTAKVFSAACPLFVPLVEEGLLNDSITEAVIERYLEPLKKKSIDTLILGCTHYPMLKKQIQNYMGAQIKLVDSIQPTVVRLESELVQKKLGMKSSGRAGRLEVFLSDKPRNFVRVGEKFLGEQMKQVKVVRPK